MRKPLCFTTAPSFVEVPPEQEPAVAEIELCVLRGHAAGQPWPEERAREVEIVFCSSPPPNLAAFTGLRWLQIESAGFSHLFPFKLGEKGITVTNARGVFDCPIAEWNIAMMVNLVRDLRTLIRNQDNRVWDRAAKFSGELRTRTVGIWGYGGIGRETARLAKALGMKVHVLTRSGKKSRADSTFVEGTGDPDGSLPDRYFDEPEREAFLRSLDFLILAMPLTAKTEGLVSEQDLRTLPKGSYLLNPARGPLIQQTALLAVLRDGHLGGAALDTHYQYPLPPEHPLWGFPHVILTPHISGTTFSPYFREGLLRIFRQNAARYVAGQPLLNVVSPADLQ
ncbi:MAG: D-2-hydroxyacid dehydrogenase [Opitutus sp.]|nr:D-2-hydroxyacid dehydrogenase [Opitutus sp.]